MTLYAPTDVQSIVIPNGCGTAHGLDGGDRLVIECGPCEAALGDHAHLGWAASPELVKLTCDEIAQAERDKAAAEKAGIARLNAYANNGGDGSTSAALVALIEQNAALMQQIAALTAAQQSTPAKSWEDLGEPVPAAPIADTPTAPAEDAVEAPVAKRGPGRPRKAPETV